VLHSLGSGSFIKRNQPYMVTVVGARRQNDPPARRAMQAIRFGGGDCAGTVCERLWRQNYARRAIRWCSIRSGTKRGRVGRHRRPGRYDGRCTPAGQRRDERFRPRRVCVRGHIRFFLREAGRRVLHRYFRCRICFLAGNRRLCVALACVQLLRFSGRRVRLRVSGQDSPRASFLRGSNLRGASAFSCRACLRVEHVDYGEYGNGTLPLSRVSEARREMKWVAGSSA
jgi:hypothetical protein